MANLSNINNKFIVTDGNNGRVLIGATNDIGATLFANHPSTTAPSLTFNAPAGQVFENEDLQIAFGLNNASPYNAYMQNRFVSAPYYRNLAINPLGGNVGIGTNSPSYNFVVSSGGASGVEFAIATATGLNEILSYNRSTSVFEKLRTQASQFEWYTDATANALVIQSGGNVGIGTISPDAKLEITTLRENGIRLSSSDITAFPDELLSGIEFYSPDTSGGAGVKASIQVKYNDGDANSYMTFSTGTNTEKMRITSAGDVLIHGAYNPYSQGNRGNITLSGSNSNIIAFTNNSSSKAYIYHNGLDFEINNGVAGILKFATNSTERMRITGGGDVLINRTARANSYDSGFKTLSVASNLNEKASIIELIGTRSEGGNQNGMLQFYTDRVTLTQTAGITGLTGTGTNGYLAGELSFLTKTTTGNLIERMRLSSVGTLTVTTDSPNGSNGIFYNNSSTTPYGVACSLPNGSADNTRYLFFGDCAGASKFKVSTAGQIYAVATSIASISDIRFKENIRDIETGLEEILKLKPRLFDWKENKGKNQKDSVGFIAQEVEKVLPKLVQENWSDNGINEDGSAIEGEKYKTVSQADMIPTLVKAIQELKADNDSLKARIETLENN